MADVDFEAEGLLEGLEDDERRARLELLEELHGDGVSLDTLKQAVEESRLALLPVELALGGEAKYTAGDVADRAGLPVEFLIQQRQALGLPRPEPDARILGDADLDALVTLKGLLDAGIPEEAVHETAVVIGESMARIADASRQVVGRALVRPGDTERDLGLRAAEASRALVPRMSEQLEYVYRLHLLEQLRNTVVDQAALRAGEMRGATEVTVAFADLVGFTKLGEGLPPEELGGVVSRLTQMAVEATEPPVRLVKTIGDAAMIAGPDTGDVVEATLRLVQMAEEEGRDFPSIRSGVAAGVALERAGDLYGSPVNVASRITGVARPASVLGTEDVRKASEDRFRWSSAGRKKLKGVKGQVAVFRARPLKDR
ncbi:MAG: adenylate cyclase regulatory domain-containing protein [Thermoleophilaceae bacterium]